MGGCMNSRSHNTERYRQSYSAPNSIHTYSKEEANPENLTSPTKSSVTQIPSTVISSGSKEDQMFPEPGSLILDVDNDQNDLNQNDVWITQNHMNSSIIRKPKKIVKTRSAQRERENVGKLMSNFSIEDELNVEIKSEIKSSRIIISNIISDIQFELPRTRAGPLVVPFIDYSLYSLPS